MERIINEFRVVETDDGFRIEIKGDKEKIRSLFSGFGKHRYGHHWRGHDRRHAWGPFGVGFGPMAWLKMACCGEPWEDEEKEEAAEA